MASDLHRKQQPDKTLQEYIQNFIDFTEKVMGVDPANIMDRGTIFSIHQESIQQRCW